MPSRSGWASLHPPAYDAEALGFFRPEFFNRIDAVVTFEPLAFETMREITLKEMHDIAAREGLSRASLRLTWTDDVIELLATRGFDRRCGARPLKRTLEQQVIAPLARFRARARRARRPCHAEASTAAIQIARFVVWPLTPALSPEYRGEGVR